ncbi:MAG: rhamnogalacturonan lyase [Planctomycetales bacterium]|nr:rhamnogalacturonan lyase [Planctomycetales bacterium]
MSVYHEMRLLQNLDMIRIHRIVVALVLTAVHPTVLLSQPVERRLESLDRGLVAARLENGNVFLSWRLLNIDTDATEFNVYRVVDSSKTKVNDAPIRLTNFVDRDADSPDHQYSVGIVRDGKEVAVSEPVSIWSEQYHEIPIKSLDLYRPGDASVGDLDGDGQYEIVLHQVSRPRDNSHEGLTGTPILDAYTLDGKHLWRIDLGVNIREGEHYTQFMVYDFDGDGRAEIACKTADGTRDADGRIIGDATADYRVKDEQDKRYGRVLDGPEFLTMFDGLTGKALQTVDYVPSRNPIDGWGGIGGNGGNDSYGNRCDRFLACVAYLDGKHPSLVMCRGVYGRIVLAAWDWRDGKFSARWTFDSGISHPPFANASPYSGMGGHSLSVADVDEDGKDEIVYQAMLIDDDGSGLYSTGLRHGDSMHISDMDPERPGQEVFTIQENEGATVRFQTPGAALRDAKTGEILWSHSPGIDVKSGLAADIDPRHPGYEIWGGPGGLRTVKGLSIGQAPRSSSFAIWWDGDLLRELVARSRITKWNWNEEREETLLDTRARGGNRGPNLVADIIGDWREELLMTSPDGKSLRLYTTVDPTEHRLTTLMHDSQYRLGIAWQNVVYNKPAHPSFFLGERREIEAPDGR